MSEVIKFVGNAIAPDYASLLSFWKWAFGDLCDDDIKGIFAEWMVGVLIGLPMHQTRRVSWANSDIILPSGLRIEVKASALWQSWKLVNEDATPKSGVLPIACEPAKVRFSGLQARSSVGTSKANNLSTFKSDYYVFCMQTQADPAAWSAWDLAQWEFYLLAREELVTAGVGRSISLAKLRRLQAPMSAAQFQQHAKNVFGL